MAIEFPTLVALLNDPQVGSVDCAVDCTLHIPSARAFSAWETGWYRGFYSLVPIAGTGLFLCNAKDRAARYTAVYVRIDGSYTGKE